MEAIEKERNYFKECVVFIPLFFAAIAITGVVCDKVLNSEAKAEEARKLGYDI